MNTKNEIIEYFEATSLTDEEKAYWIGLSFELLELIDQWDGERPTTLKNLFPEKRRNSIPSGDHYRFGRHVSALVKLNVLPIKHSGKHGNTHLYIKIQ